MTTDGTTMTWYGVLFWVWLVVSTAIFVSRRFRAATVRRQARAAALAPVVTAAAVTVPSAPPAPRAAAPVPPPAPAPPAAPTAPMAPMAEALTTEAAPAGLPTIAEIRAMRQPSVLTVLEGVRFPCDLSPLTAETGDLTVARRVVAATTGHGAGEVATALADELERLGFTVQGVADDQAIATGPRGALHLTVYARNAPFATAPDHAVVIEIALI